MQLQVHPAGSAGPVHRFDATARLLPAGGLRVEWRLVGDLDRLVLPSPGHPMRADGLWRGTCFEVFMAGPGAGTAYREFNFAPSGAWAAYGFTGYREGMASLDLARDPEARWTREPTSLTLVVHLGPDAGAAGRSLRLGLAAVLKEHSGTMSYWALAHPPGAPDFHHPDGFALELAAE